MWEKKEITKFCNKLSMKVNLPIEFNREKYDFSRDKWSDLAHLTHAIKKIKSYIYSKQILLYL